MRRRYICINGELIEVGADYRQVLPATVSHNVIPDIQPYQSMVDGQMIQGRRQHREHLRQHRLVEVGNETKHLMKQPKYEPAPGLKETLIREVHRAQEAQRNGRKY